MGRLVKFFFAFPFIYILILEILDFFYADYYINDEFQLTSKTYIYILVISIIVFFGLVSWISSEKDQFIKIIKGLAYGTFFGFSITFYAYLVAPQTIFYLNNLHSKQEIEDLYTIRYKSDHDGDLDISLLSVQNDIYFHTTNKISIDDYNRLKERDTVKLRYRIGLLNKPFLSFGKLDIIK